MLARYACGLSLTSRSVTMNRRDFLAASATARRRVPGRVRRRAGRKPLRVGLIGCGWYGKCDLLRLIQVAPVEVVSLCDVDKKMLADAADILADAREVRQEAAHLHRLPGDAQGEGPRRRRWSPRPTTGTRCR